MSNYARANTDNASQRGIPDSFCRNMAQFRLPRRYILAMLLFLLLLINNWRNSNVSFLLIRPFLDLDGKQTAIGNWTVNEIKKYDLLISVFQIFAQIPGAILIFVVGSRNYLLTSVMAISVLHMLTPLVLQHHSISLVFVLVSKAVFDAPTFIAVISIWKDWAPPKERTKLIVFSMAGLFISYATAIHLRNLGHFFTSNKSFYISGVAGLVWALLFYNVASDMPQNDPLVSERELLYIENHIPSCNQQKILLKDIPWKSILISKPVLILCVIFFKAVCSNIAIANGGLLIFIYFRRFFDSNSHQFSSIFIPFSCLFVILIPCSAILADYLINKFSGRTLLIRKAFLCGGFVLQCVFMVGTLPPLPQVKIVSFLLTYLIYAVSLPGFMTIALDLSPRYVTILTGIVFTAFYLGQIAMGSFLKHILSSLELTKMTWISFFDGVLSLISAALFAFWGEVDEQLWSLTLTSPRSGGCKSYPAPNDRDDQELDPENV